MISVRSRGAARLGDGPFEELVVGVERRGVGCSSLGAVEPVDVLSEPRLPSEVGPPDVHDG